MMRRHLVVGLIHAAAWFGTLLLVEIVMRSSASRVAYAAINAWWLTLYLALVLRSTWRDAIAFLFWMNIAAIVGAVLGLDWFYHDPPELSSPSFILVLALMSALWISPFMINGVVALLRRTRLSTT